MKLSGRIIDAAGNPRAGWTINPQFGDGDSVPFRAAQSDERGSFVAETWNPDFVLPEEMRASATFSFALTDPESRSVALASPTLEWTPEGDIVVELQVGETRPVRVTGTLVTAGGTPVTGWHIGMGVAVDDGTVPSFAAQQTDERGGFVLESGAAVPAGVRWRPYCPVYDQWWGLVAYAEPKLEWSGDWDANVVVEVPDSLVEPAQRPPQLFGVVFDPITNAGVAGVEVFARDTQARVPEQSATTSDTGTFALSFADARNVGFVDVDLRILRDGERLPTWPNPQRLSPGQAAFVHLALTWEINGTVIDRTTGSGIDDFRVEPWIEYLSGTFPAGTAVTSGGGKFSIQVSRERFRPKPPQPTFRLYRYDQLVDTLTPQLEWTAAGRARVELGSGAKVPDFYRLVGTAVERTSRRGVAGLRVEAWNADATFMLQARETDGAGRFEFALPAQAGQAPAPLFRFYRDGQLIAQPQVPIVWKPDATAEVFVEVDAPAQAPPGFRISGRVIDVAARSGLAGIRVEAWDTAPRDGGFVGVATDTAPDGTFELQLPRAALATAPVLDGKPVELRLPAAGMLIEDRIRPVAGMLIEDRIRPVLQPRVGTGVPTAPDVFFRLYFHERLLATTTPKVSWTPDAIGTVVIEIPAPATPPVSHEVGLHELGESIASTVDRVQTELARYPSSMGAYLLDEVNLSIPVEMRIDELGLVRTKVVDSTLAASPNVGQVQMKVRPVLGATPPPADIPDQPLSVLRELTADAIAKLQQQRIYSVEDLARAARSAAGRSALASLDLGVELDALLAKAGLLAFPLIPRAVREALIELGITDLAAFARNEDPAKLATQLTQALAQEISEADVRAWQKKVHDAIVVPLPTAEHNSN
jgi:hypothetical protein